MDATPPIFALLDNAGPSAASGGWHQARSRLYRDHAGTLACHTIAEWPLLLARLQEALARGEIQQVLPEWQMDRLHSYLLLKEQPQPSSPITLLCDALITALGAP